LIRWREWSTAAFDEAAGSDKLVALFITAFWCGVCQHLDETALSSDEVQLLLNAYFVPIRLEEAQRPDVDLRYTRDGWPTIVFLTPTGEPILTVNGLETDALVSLLVHLVDLHERKAENVTRDNPPPVEAPNELNLSHDAVEDVIHLLAGLEDHTDGGFGRPHKYFFTDALAFYLHLAERNPRSLQHVCFTLDILTQRAIYDGDHGGFFRYSSKPDWNEPHREKLLSDQASLLRIYLWTFERVNQERYGWVAEKLVEYLDGTLARNPYFAGCQDYVRTVDSWTPIVDGLVYCDANALAASAYLDAARVLGRDDCRDRALRLLDAVWNELRVPGGGVYHYLDESGPHVPGLLSDSVAVGTAVLDAYLSTGADRFLRRAAQVGHDILRMHLNPQGGFVDISEAGPAALQRPLTALTQNAAAAMFFLRLADVRDDARLRDAARWALLAYHGDASIYGAYSASFGHALDMFLT
jgi:uncharacterized protein YyaL (SSP411 family)